MKVSITKRLVAAMIVAIAIVAFPACGKPEGDAPAKAAGVSGSDGAQGPMRGYAAFGTQCNSGFSTDPKAVKLELWSCPLKVPVVELAEPIQPLNFQADCARKTLTIRSYDRSIDDTWLLYPDGSFRITQERLGAKLKDDGSGHGVCATPISMEIWGKVECSGTNRDQAKIRFETVMWLNKGPVPSSLSGMQKCTFPADKCYFHAITTLNQCS